MKPLFEQIAAMQDIIRGSEPETVPARRYPDWRVVKPKPRKPASCSACLDTGDTESGRACNWCSISDGPATLIDENDR